MRKLLGTLLTGGPLSSPGWCNAVLRQDQATNFPVAENGKEAAHILPVFIIFIQGIFFKDYFLASHAFELININVFCLIFFLNL